MKWKSSCWRFLNTKLFKPRLPPSLFSYRFLFLGIFVALFLVALILVLSSLRFDPSLEYMIPQNNEWVILDKTVNATFGNAREMIVMLSAPNPIYSPSSLRDFQALERDLAQQQEFQEGYSTSYLSILRTNYSLNDLPLTQEFASQVQEDLAVQAPLFRGLISEDLYSALLIFPLKYEVNSSNDTGLFLQASVHEILQPYLDKGYSYTLTGNALLDLNIPTYINKDLFLLLPLAITILSFFLLLFLRNFLGVLVPFLVTSFSILLVFALKALFNIPVTLAEGGIPIIIFSVSCADGFHIVHEVFHQMRGGLSKKQAIGKTMQLLYRALLMTGGTTATAGIFLTLSSLPSVRYMGLSLAFGMIVATLSHLSITPSLLYLLPIKDRQPKESLRSIRIRVFWDKVVDAGVVWMLKYRWLILSFHLGLIGIFAFSVSQLRVLHNDVEYLRSSNEMRRNLEKVEQSIGGLYQYYVLFESQEKAVDTYELVHFEQALSQNLETLPYVAGTAGFHNILQFVNYRLKNRDPQSFTLPPSRSIYRLLLNNLQQNPLFNSYSQKFISSEQNLNLLSIRLIKADTKTIQTLEQHLNNYLDNHMPSGYTARYAGQYIKQKIASAIVKEQIINLLISLLAIFVLLLVVYRSVRASIYIIIPIILAVFLNFVIMQLFNIPLSSGTALISALTVGIGIDYSIHVFSRFYMISGARLSILETIKNTVKGAYRSIIFTAFSVVLGFSVLIFSEYNTLVEIGIIVSLSMITTALNSLILLPIMLYSSQPTLQSYLFKRVNNKR